MSEAPGPARRAANPTRRWVARVAGLLGLVLFIGWAIAWLSGNFAGTTVEYGNTYTWQSGSAIYLLASSGHYETTTCTIRYAASEEQHTARIPGGAPRLLDRNVFSLTGLKLGRAAPGGATITCDQQIVVSTGLVLWILPFAYTAVPPILGLVLLVVWGYLTGRDPFKWVVPRSRLPLDPTA